jgi:glutamyl-tRNA reductase
MPVVVVGLSHRTATVEIREQFAFPDAAIPTTLQRLRDSGLAQEAVILSTCNRVELYAAVPAPEQSALPSLQQFLQNGRPTPPLTDGLLYSLGEPHSLEHLFRVACGLDSMVLGETEILGQLKHAYDLALQNKQTGYYLNKVFQKAFNVAKQIRTETNIQRGSISVASVAVELAERIFNSLKDRHVLVIGAGDTSEKTARALMSRGAGHLLVSNRTHERAVNLANALGGRAIPFYNWSREFSAIDIVISSTAAPDYVLDRAMLTPLMKARENRPLLLIDIAVPRDIEPEVNFLENVYLYNVDDLQAIANDYLKLRQEEITRCEGIIREHAQAILAALTRSKPPGVA